MLDKDKFWSNCIFHLKKYLDERVLNNWFRPISLLSLDQISENGKTSYKIVLEVPNEEFRDFLIDNYQSCMQKVFDICLSGAEYDVYVKPKVSKTTNTESNGSNTQGSRYNSGLNKNLSFDTFIQSECNKVVVSLAKTIAFKPGQAPHNVFFLYGASGVGKTHLCQAVGNMVEDIHPDKRVCYVTCGEFERQYVHSASITKDKSRFISFYQSVDVLIIDDIQGLVNKVGTQTAFFEIFNHLKNLNKQIILTCDTPIVELKGMAERIQTRIQSSIMLELERPDINLRRQLLQRHLAESGITLGEEYSEYIVCNANKNLREIEGICYTLGAIGQSNDIDLGITRKVVESSVSVTTQNLGQELTIKKIHETVSEVFGIEMEKLLEKRRTSDRVLPRQVIMYLASEYTSQSLQMIASYFNLSTHSTIVHGKNNIINFIESDKDIRAKVEDIKSRLSLN